MSLGFFLATSLSLVCSLTFEQVICTPAQGIYIYGGGESPLLLCEGFHEMNTYFKEKIPSHLSFRYLHLQPN